MAKRVPLPSAEVLRELLDYDPETGIFLWKVYRGRTAKASSVAGSQRPSGHIVIKVRCGTYMAHRLAWVLMTGNEPELDPDHKNGDASDNRWDNLRLATFAQNIANSRRRKDNTTGFRGVYQRRGKYLARIVVAGEHIHLGTFSCPTAAGAAYQRASRQYYGEFARAA